LDQIDWGRVREDFPAAQKFRYFLSASGGPLPGPVKERVCSYYEDLYQWGDSHWEIHLEEREHARKLIAQLINADTDEVEFIHGTSAGMNLVAGMLASQGDAISAKPEFPSTTLPWLKTRPNSIQWVSPDSEGAIPAGYYLEKLGESTSTILTSHVQFSNGFRQDLGYLGRKKGDHYLVVNGTQSLGAFELDVKQMNIDALCCNGYKWLLGGYGTGFVYVSREILKQTEPNMVGWFGVKDPEAFRNDQFQHLSSAERFSLGSPSFPTIFALSSSVQYLLDLGIRNIQERVLDLNRYLTSALIEAGLKVLSPLASEDFRSGQTLVQLRDPSLSVKKLKDKKILCTEKPQGIRIATHFFNTYGDIDILIRELRTLDR